MTRPASLFVLLFGLASIPLQSTSAAYPEWTIHSPTLKATGYLPDPTNGYYRGTRFDWSGLVSRVDCGGHTFFSEFKREHDPLNHDDTCGTSEEFGIEAAPSYAEAKAGDPFIKIGIGVLERADNSDYGFWKRYKILKAGYWRDVIAPDKINFRQRLQGPRGWAYDYTKIVELGGKEPVLKIRRRLNNIGTQTIEADHYDHNFLRIDDVPAGTNYTLEFAFTPAFGKDSKTQDCMEIKDRSLRFTKQPNPDQGIWVRLQGFTRPEDNWIKVVNHATGASMTISTDRPLSKLVFYSSGGVLCPEAFVKVSLRPGQIQEWTTTYRFESKIQ